MRACASCGGSMAGKDARARFCGDRCRDREKKRVKRAGGSGRVVELAPRVTGGDAASPHPLVASLLAELRDADREHTADGLAALLAAERLVAAMTGDTASSFAALLKQFGEAKARALAGTEAREESAADRLRARARAKRGA